MRFTTIILMGLLAMVAVYAETGAEERFVQALEQSGVQYIYTVDAATVRFVKTAKTANAIEKLVADKPSTVKVEYIVEAVDGKIKLQDEK